MNRYKSWLLGVAVLAQIFILCGMYLKAHLPLYNGTEIRVRTEPVDPRSIFRGNYARLNYHFNQVELADYPDQSLANETLKPGSILYAQLQPDGLGHYELDRIVFQKPKAGIFLRGRARHVYWLEDTISVELEYGIEAFFAPKDKALALERDLRKNGIAVLMVSADGHARLKNIEAAITDKSTGAPQDI